MPNQRADVVVVGAGLAGLTAAVDLYEAGVDVLIVDRAERPGGRVATQHVDGFTIDQGFQVINTSYPQVRRRVDVDALGLAPFTPAALVSDGARLHRVAGLRAGPMALAATLRSGVFPLTSLPRLAALAAWSLRAGWDPIGSMHNQDDRPAYETLRARGVAGPVLDRFVRPFLSGVLADERLETSIRYVDLVWRSFVRGEVGVPRQGMQALPEQLVRRLPDDACHWGVSVHGVAGGRVRSDEGVVTARAIVVATDPQTASVFIPSLGQVRMRSSTTYYHTVPQAPLREPTLVLDGRADGIVANSVVLTEAAPEYSRDGRALVATSVVGAPGPPESLVREHLVQLYGVPAQEWELVTTVSIPAALPSAAAPMGAIARAVDLGDGLFVAGDHRDTPSIQGAMASGTRAARAVLTRLHGR